MRALALILISAMPLTGGVVELLPSPTVSVFGGGRRVLDVVFRNLTQTNVQLAVSVQLLQASSATVAPWSESQPWRALALQARQTSMEQVEIDVPAVQAESPFLVRFVSGRAILGIVPVHVYPGNVLTNLAHTAGGVLISSVKPDLRRVLIEAGFRLSEANTLPPGGGRPKLAISGPEFSGKEAADIAIGEAISRARSGLGVVLILSDYNERRSTAPSYYPTRVSQGTLVTVREGTLDRLSTDPLAQLRLARIIRLALGQESLNLPASDL